MQQDVIARLSRVVALALIGIALLVGVVSHSAPAMWVVIPLVISLIAQMRHAGDSYRPLAIAVCANGFALLQEPHCSTACARRPSQA